MSENQQTQLTPTQEAAVIEIMQAGLGGHTAASFLFVDTMAAVEFVSGHDMEAQMSEAQQLEFVTKCAELRRQAEVYAKMAAAKALPKSTQAEQDTLANCLLAAIGAELNIEYGRRAVGISRAVVCGLVGMGVGAAMKDLDALIGGRRGGGGA